MEWKLVGAGGQERTCAERLILFGCIDAIKTKFVTFIMDRTSRVGSDVDANSVDDVVHADWVNLVVG